MSALGFSLQKSALGSFFVDVFSILPPSAVVIVVVVVVVQLGPSHLVVELDELEEDDVGDCVPFGEVVFSPVLMFVLPVCRGAVQATQT